MKTNQIYRPEKEAMVEEIRRDVTGSPYVFLVDYKGLTVERVTELRRRLRPVRARFRVVPNRLFLKAAPREVVEPLKPMMRGQTAMVFGDGDAAEAARVIRQFVQETRQLAAKGGILQGRVMGPGDLEQLANLPSKEVLRAQLVGALAAPMQRLAGVLRSKVASIVYVLKAIEDKKGGGTNTAAG